MDKDKKPEDEKEKQDAPAADAAAKSGGDDKLDKPSESDAKDGEASSDGGSDTDKDGEPDQPAEKTNPLKRVLKKFWLYLVILLLIAVIGAIFAVVSSLNGKKTPPPPSLQSQSYSSSQLKQLANSGLNATGQTITIQGDSVLDGQELVKGSLYVAGSILAGGSLSTPALTLSNTGSLGNATASSLEVATTSTLGSLTSQNNVDVNGPTSISDVTFGTLTATKLVMSGKDSVITVPHHLMFTGAFPYRTISFGVLGNGGSASVNGSDTNGTVSINTGNNPQPGCFITVIFLIPFAHTPNILLGPIGLGAGAAQRNVELITDPTTGDTTAFKICTANTPLPNQAFAFSYLVDDAPN